MRFFVSEVPLQEFMGYPRVGYSRKAWDRARLPKACALGPRGVLGGWAFSYGRGTPVDHQELAHQNTCMRSLPDIATFRTRERLQGLLEIKDTQRRKTLR